VTNDSVESSSYKQAMNHSQWLNTMQFEYHALVQNNTRTLNSLSAGANLVGWPKVFNNLKVMTLPILLAMSSSLPLLC